MKRRNLKNTEASFFEESISGITRRSVMAEQEGESEETESKINQWTDYSQREQPTYGGMNEFRKHSFTNDENVGEEKGTKSGDIKEAERNISNEGVKTELDEVAPKNGTKPSLKCNIM